VLIPVAMTPRPALWGRRSEGISCRFFDPLFQLSRWRSVMWFVCDARPAKITTRKFHFLIDAHVANFFDSAA